MKRSRLSLFLGLIILTSVWAAPVSADGHDQDQIVHVVQPGQNLFRIALHYGTTVDAIMAANGLADPRMIYVGQRLVIPQGSGASAATAGPAASGGMYVVQRGDTLTRIALRHGVTVAALMGANGLSNPHTIYVGQRLVIPSVGGIVPASPPVAPETYVVCPGDTLGKIAQRFGTTVNAIARLNGIVNPSAIYPGQTLRLSGTPPTVPAGGSKRIVVNLTEQHLYAYEGDRLVYSFVASSGAAPNYTRMGEFRVQSKIPRAYGSAWGIWMPHWLGIYWAGPTENGIHALPILSNGQTLWAGYLGQPVSYGCIVLGIFEAQLLYDWAEIGTPVSIRN